MEGPIQEGFWNSRKYTPVDPYIPEIGRVYMKIRLKQVIEVIEMADEAYTAFGDRQTRKPVFLDEIGRAHVWTPVTPRKPCSGEKIATTLNLFSSSMSSKCLSPTIPEWLEKIAIRFPFRIGKYSEVCSSPKTMRSFCAWHSNELHLSLIHISSYL